MIEKFHIENGANDYAIISDPDRHQEEREQLEHEGYTLWSRYWKEDHQEELWMK